MPNGPSLEQADRQPARARERGQQQRVEPDGEARGKAAERPGAGAAFPEYSAQDRRSELRDRGERDETDRNERIRLAGDPEVQVAQNEDQHDGAAPYAKQEPGEVGTLVQPQPSQSQEHRHHEIVAHHGRQGDRLDDDHPGGGGEAADEYEQREELVLLRHRQREHERVGVDAAVGKPQQPAERDRQDEDVDREHVQRKQPDRLVEMLLVDVLDHGDLELPRQEHDRHHRQDREPCPVRVAAGNAFERRHHRPQLGLSRRPREEVAEAVVDAEGDESADGEKREELHQRFERDRGHHALVMLGGVEVARAEGDGERGQDQRHPQRGILAERCRADLGRHDDFGILDEDREAVRHCLQLQGDVRQDADDGDDRDEAAQERALAVARRDEVGEGRDAVLFRDAQDLAQHHPPQRDHQRRADVDRQEPDPVARRAADAAVERPCRRVDRERQAVHVRARDDRTAGVGALVGEIGDGEQQPEVAERDEDDGRPVQHGAVARQRPDSAIHAISAISAAQATNM